MALDTQERQNVKYFVGYEVEHTICHGMKTLFIVGVQPVDLIIKLVHAHQTPHVYFGTSQSFPDIGINDAGAWKPWETMIKGVLEKGLWATLDLDARQAEGLLESGLTEFDKFVPMISVKLPYINQFNYNTTIKLDDKTWGATNPGVWTHQLHELMSMEKYTHWDQYTQDTAL
jgi:hypothetical protein